MKIAAPNFPEEVWDGLSYQYDSVTVDKNPDFFWKDQVTAEIVSIEQYLIKTIYNQIFHESAEEGNIIASNMTLGDSQDESRIHIIGLANGFTPAGDFGGVQTVGIKQLENWFSIIGEEYLEPGHIYYLAEDGKMTSQLPVTGWLVKVGRALTPIQFLINIQEPIKL